MTNIKIKCLNDRGGFFNSGSTEFEISVDGYNGTDEELKKLLAQISLNFEWWRKGT